MASLRRCGKTYTSEGQFKSYPFCQLQLQIICGLVFKSLFIANRSTCSYFLPQPYFSLSSVVGICILISIVLLYVFVTISREKKANSGGLLV